jgi:hypothetical protein
MKAKKDAIYATKYLGMHQAPTGCPVWHTVADAAESCGASKAAIRLAAKRAGVVRISGPSVAGMVAIRADGRLGFLPFSR